jgi:hypothetical protein
MSMDIIYSHTNNWYHADFARRLHADLPDPLRATARLLNVVEWLDSEPSDHVVVVNWEEAVREPRLGPRVAELCARVAHTPRRTLLSAECVGTTWFELHFAEGIAWTDFIEVGWFGYPLPEPYGALPYHVLGTVATRAEQEQFRQLSLALEQLPAQGDHRPLPWAFVGMRTPERIAFARELVRWQPNGLLLLAEPGPARPGSGRLTGDGLERLLHQARLYIWRTQHSVPYFETFRVHDALRCGALPVKIDPSHADSFATVPCVFPSLDAMKEALATSGWAGLLAAMYAAALTRPALGDAFAAIVAGQPPANHVQPV